MTELPVAYVDDWHKRFEAMRVRAEAAEKDRDYWKRSYVTMENSWAAVEDKLAALQEVIEGAKLHSNSVSALLEIYDALAKSKESPNASSDFRRIDTENTSTLVCPCGARFNWSGVSDRLNPWREHHRAHLIKSKEASDV